MTVSVLGFENIVIIINLIVLLILFEKSHNSPLDSPTKDETLIQKMATPGQPRDTKLNPPIAEEEMKDPCQTAEILEHPWRHWSYDDSEVPLENGKKKYECDAYWLPLRRWFGFSVNGIRSEIIYGHVKSHRCGTIHPLSLSFDNSLLFQQSMLYPQLKSVQNNDGDVDESENEDDDDEEENDEAEKYFNKGQFSDLQNEETNGLKITPSNSILHAHTSKNFTPKTSAGPSLQVYEPSLYSDESVDYQNMSSNQSHDHTQYLFSNSSILNISDQNSTTHEVINSFPSLSSSSEQLPQIHSLPKYERIYDSIFESHSRRLYSYMLRDLDIIQELQQFLQLQQLLVNSSVISKELHEDHILLQSINSSIESQFSQEVRDHFERNLSIFEANITEYIANASIINMLDYYVLLRKLEEQIEKKDEMLEKKRKTLSDERDKIMKLRKTKLHSKKKNQRVAFLRQNYTVAQLCVYHRFLEESSCADALSVPIVIKKCPSGAVYWLEKMVLQCPSGVCVKKMNETVSYEVFLNIPKEELMLKPLSRLIDRDLKSVVSIEFNVSVDHVDMKNICSILRPILAKKLKLTISMKSKSPRKFLKVKGKPIERNYTRNYKEEKFEGAIIPDLDPDAAGPMSQDKRKKKIKRDTRLDEEQLSQEVEKLKIDLEGWGGIEALLMRAPSQDPPTTPIPDLLLDNRNSKESEEEYTTEDLELVKFVDYEPVVLEGKLRISIFVDGNTSLAQTDVLDAVKALNATGELDLENMTFAAIYPGFPGDISQLRTGGRAVRFWQENKDMLSCAFVILGILSAFIVIFYLCRFYKRKKKMKLSFDGKRFNKSAQTDHMITGYIFGTSTPIISFSKKRHRESIANEAIID